MSLRYSERLIMRFGPRQTLIAGLFLIGAGLLVFARTPVDGTFAADILPPMLLTGLGIGTSFPSLMTLAMSGATQEDAGLASGLVNTSAQVGGAVGLAVLATLATQRTDTLLDSGTAHAAALNSGFHLAYLVGAALVGIAIAIAIFVLRPAPVPAMAAEHAEETERAQAEPAYSEVG
jgi:MFS family permease